MGVTIICEQRQIGIRATSNQSGCSRLEHAGRWQAEEVGGALCLLQVAYVLAVIPNVLITTGGTCDPKEVCSVRALRAMRQEHPRLGGRWDA